MIKFLMDEVIPFVQQVYFTDACAFAALYPDWMNYGKGVTQLPGGARPADSTRKASAFDLPGGVHHGRQPGERAAPSTDHRDGEFREAVTEDLTHAWYKGNAAAASLAGRDRSRVHRLQDNGKYTWVKAPRYDGKPMQVGPLAQVLVGLRAGTSADQEVDRPGAGQDLSDRQTQVTVNDLQSTMGRHVARAIRAAMLSELATKHWEYLVDQHQPRRPRHFTTRRSFPTAKSKAWARTKLRAERCRTGWWSQRQPRQLPGRRADHLERQPARREGHPGPYEASLPEIRSPIRKSRWRCCARCTRSIPAWRAPVTRSTRKAGNSAGSGCSDSCGSRSWGWATCDGRRRRRP